MVLAGITDFLCLDTSLLISSNVDSARVAAFALSKYQFFYFYFNVIAIMIRCNAFTCMFETCVVVKSFESSIMWY